MIRNIRQRQKDAALIVASHRLSAVLNTDLVYFLNISGELVIDRSEELLKKNKEFFNLFAGQRKR